jgi:Tfp pilus assembly protein PilF
MASKKTQAASRLNRQGGIESRDLFFALFLFAMVCVAYVPATQNTYIWDDDSYVVQQPALRTIEGLKSIWLDLYATPQYYPLVFTSFWLEYRIVELHPALYHWDNVILHGLNAILLWIILRHLAVPGAWLAAAVFAVHPVHVESVAWITERKNLLSGFFYLSSLAAYLRFRPMDSRTSAPPVDRSASDVAREKGAARLWYFLALGLYVCALFSKTITCSLPAVLVLLIWWKDGTISKRDAASLAPFFIVGLCLGLLTAWLEKHHVRAEGKEFDLTFVDRVLIAGRALWFYAGKLAWPVNLTFIYPRWKLDTQVWWQYIYPVGFLVLIGILWGIRQRIGRGPLVAVLCFAGTLLPALGFFDVYPMRYSFVADHFQYLASIGIIVLGVALLTGVARRLWGSHGGIRAVAAGGLLAILGTLTWSQCYAYYDKPTLWGETLRRNPECWLAHDALGSDCLARKELAAAEQHFRAALEIDPDHPEGHCNLGVTLLEQANVDKSKGRNAEAKSKEDEAISHFRQALRANPKHFASRESLGLALLQQGKRDGAKEEFRRVMELEPNYGRAHLDFARVLLQEGNIEAAKQEIVEGLRVEPNLATAHHMLAIILLDQNKTPQAIEELVAELKINPQNAKALHLLQQLQQGLDQGRMPPKEQR